MGSGPSTEKSNTRPGGAKPVTVANVNNNTAERVRTVESKSVNRNESETTNSSPVKSPTKESNRGNSKSEQSQSKSVKNEERKITGKMEWDDSDLEDDWDDFLGKTTSKNYVSKTDSKVSHVQQERDLNTNNNRESEAHYPETYAQRHTRQQYTFGQDRLIREKTIYRNPDEWRTEDDEEENKTNPRDQDWDRQTIDDTMTKGFDASKFRAANQGQSARDKDIFTPRDDDIELPKHKPSNEPAEPEPHYSNRKIPSRKLPTYTKEEEDLMEELIGGGVRLDLMLGHQAADPANVMSF